MRGVEVVSGGRDRQGKECTMERRKTATPKVRVTLEPHDDAATMLAKLAYKANRSGELDARIVDIVEGPRRDV